MRCESARFKLVECTRRTSFFLLISFSPLSFIGAGGVSSVDGLDETSIVDGDPGAMAGEVFPGPCVNGAGFPTFRFGGRPR